MFVTTLRSSGYEVIRANDVFGEATNDRELLEYCADQGHVLITHDKNNERFHVERLSDDSLATAKSLFDRHQALSFVDACIVALGREREISYLYAFDDGFDRLADVERLDTAVDPFVPE